ncbi:hypothetical protein LOZ80_05165 [Paenibacillus sp. HWE-109]|uniref:hypothetical protein n=1 Tax=Paenibacillus sp. HWE-109 TaxID=1306526 RepID=UPI001EDEA9D3|nr:hypothetical protein [Paenibacillus sp. HWE-109]UKS28329.1 hypothetical protein LOZ80_05165 [Paenibacillus sp. HWE-109]
MKKKLLVSMLAVILSCGSVAYGASDDTHWVTKELKEYKEFILPYRDNASTSIQGSISLKEWNSFQINVLDGTKLNNPIVLDDWATALKMATALPEKDSEAWIKMYVHELGQGTEITREHAVGGMVKLLIGSFIKGSWSGEELKPAKALQDYQDISDNLRGLVEIAYIQGVLDATVQDKFRPNDKLTNAEAISMMFRVMGKLAYNMPILPANHWLTEELEAAYQSGKLPKPMLKVLRRSFQDPMNTDRNIPVGLWHEMLLSGLPVPAYIREKASVYTLAYNQDGGILRDRAVVGVTKLGKNPRSATLEEKINAEKAFTDYRDAFDSDKIAVAYGDGLLEGQTGQSFGDHSYLTYAEAAALAVRASLREALNEIPLLIDEEAALQIAKKLDPDSKAEWKATFKKSLVLHDNKNRQIYDGWVVEEAYPAGNKMVVYMDARTGKIMVVSEIEAPFEGID